jgi:hypothetical protein
MAGIPEPDARVGEELDWWERFRILLQAFPPPQADAPFLQAREQLGLIASESPFVEIDAERPQCWSRVPSGARRR